MGRNEGVLLIACMELLVCENKDGTEMGWAQCDVSEVISCQHLLLLVQSHIPLSRSLYS